MYEGRGNAAFLFLMFLSKSKETYVADITTLYYSSTRGQTAEICRRLQAAIEEASGKTCILAPVKQARAGDLKACSTIVLGASIVYGKYRPEVRKFLETHRELLRTKETAFFSVNVTARKPHRATPESNPYAARLLAMAGFTPNLAAVFAGKVDYPAYGPFDRFMIRLIMRITKGPTDTSRSYEFTDWEAVQDFGHKIAAL